MRSLLLLLALLSLEPLARAETPDAGPPNDEVIAALRAAGAFDNPNFVPNWPVVLDRLRNVQSDKQNEQVKYRLLGAVVAAFVLKKLMDFLMNLRAPKPAVKKALPWILTALGAIIAVIDAWLNGTPWTSAVLLAGAAPGAVVMNELGNALRGALSSEPTAPPAPPASGQ